MCLIFHILRTAITVFPQREAGKPDWRIWNAQVYKYAGFKQADGSIIGDPVSVELTEVSLEEKLDKYVNIIFIC